MLKIKITTLYSFLILSVAILIYLLPGYTQFFLGVPSTAYALGLTFFICLIVFFDILVRKRIILNKAIIAFLFLSIIIVVSGFVNRTEFLKVLLYLNFAATPLVISYLIEILNKRNLFIRTQLSRLFFIIVLIQLPFVVLQKYFYNFLIQFSNANQVISEVDFMFGTFALKADHALGFFLIIYLLSIIFKIKSGKLKNKINYFTLIYISFIIVIIESNLTKVILLLIIGYYFALWVFKKISIFGIFLVVLGGFFLFKLAMTSRVIESQMDHYTRTLNKEYSIKAVERGYEKRPHIVIYQLNNESFKWIGNGPYDYYNILKGEFKRTIHFSQIIWFYNDLGLIGLILGVIALFLVIKNLNLGRESTWLFMGIMILYLFMTNVLGDVSMMFSLLLLNNKLENN
ncbi:hypothetical protein [Seonamhaeicola maritimus]|uniref:hypothetical protein n=1 Tax=Seonamhaeicola maritimus TaxID=2591822 RepID=UPI0024945F36|nr:hypothetical protein [Seonamhaeicola maritimus]